jgi:hypothetical protein
MSEELAQADRAPRAATAEARAAALDRLLADGLLERTPSGLGTTRRFRAAMARAALRLVREGAEGFDLRVPITRALVELYGPGCPDEDLVLFVALLWPVETAGLVASQAPSPP